MNATFPRRVRECLRTLSLLATLLLASAVEAAGTLGEGTGAPQFQWQTGGAGTFACGNWPDAQGPAAAVVTLAPGQEAWIETTVTGAGFLDYETLCDPACQPPPASEAWRVRMWNYACYIPRDRTAPLTVLPPQPDDVTVIRWTVQAPSDAPTATRWALRAVRWTPVTLVPQQGGYQPWRLTEGTGPAGGRAFLCVPDPSETAIRSLTVTGPAVVRWQSLPPSGGFGGFRFSVTVNGGPHLGLSPYRSSEAWLDHELTVPEGSHEVQWILRGPEGYDADDSPYAWYPTSAYRMTEPVVVPGPSATAEALDLPGLLFLTRGAVAVTGAAEAHDGQDALRLPPGTCLHVVGSGPARLRLLRRKLHPESAWEEQLAFREAGPFVWTQHVYAGQQEDDVVDGLRMTALAPVALDAAVEWPGLSAPATLTGSRWQGLAGPEFSHDGTDAAVSIMTREGLSASYPREMRLSVTGPARLAFWWRVSGFASLQLVFNDHVLPLPQPSGGQWQHCSLMVPTGAHTIKWRHITLRPEIAVSGEAEAAVDEISLTPGADATLAEALGTPGRAFTAISQTNMRGWQPLAWSIDHGPLQSVIMAPGRRYGFNKYPSLSTTVTGPAVVSFRWDCKTSFAADSRAPVWQPAEFQLAVDDVPVRAIAADGNGDWTAVSQYIGPGTHQVTWRHGVLYMAPTYDFLVGHYLRDLTITTPAQHYAQWAATHQLPPGQPDDHDTDGDGVADLMEYAFGLNPRAHDAPAVQLRIVPDGNDLHLFVPRPAGVLPVVVETSSDLAMWTQAFNPLPARVPFIRDGGLVFANEQEQTYRPSLPEWTNTPQRFSLPRSSGSQFVRLRVTAGPSAP